MINIILKSIIFIGFIFVSPLIALSMIAIFLENGLPVIFVQERLGMDRKIFKIYKIRTMKKNTPNKGTHEIDNINYLICGNYIRKFKLDELPQIVNYLKNDINLVGPRPGLPSQKELEQQRLNNNVFISKPGITGLSQILGYDMSDPKKLSKVDRLYIEKKSLKLDVLIFFATFFKSIRMSIAKIFSEELNQINKNV